MKKSSTFHLEQDIYDIIDDYKATYNLTSRNDALTRILIEYRTIHSITKPKAIDIKSDKSDIKEKIEDVKLEEDTKEETDVTEKVSVEETNKEDDEMSKVITDVYNHMPE